MIGSTTIFLTKFLCYYFGLILSGCSKTVTSNVGPQTMVPDLITHPGTSIIGAPLGGMVSEIYNQVLKCASRTTKQVKLTVMYASDYRKEMNGIVDPLQKNQNISSNQLQIALNFAVLGIKSAVSTADHANSAASHAFNACSLVQPADPVMKKLAHSLTMVKGLSGDLKQILKDLREADAQNIRNLKFRIHLDDCMGKSIELKKMADKLAKSSIVLVKRVAKSRQRSTNLTSKVPIIGLKFP